jgi:O-antigen ligase/tetratricopeptide (TPR) repeat protein
MRTRDRMTAGVGLLALLVAVLGVGGAPRSIVVVIVVLAAIAAAGQLGSRRKLEGVSPLILFLGMAVGLTALQLVPLPPGLRSLLAETGHDLIADGRVLMGASDVEWRPLSLDPPATLVELAKFCGYVLIAWMALRAAASERGRARLLMAVAGTAGLVTLIALVHELLGARTLFGIYSPSHSSPIVMAPLLNANHLACFVVLGAIIAAGLALHERKVPAMRVLWIAIAIGCVAVLLATRSRGGVIGFGAGATVMAVLVVLQRLRSAGDSSRKDVMRIVIPAAITVLCTLVLVIYIGGGKVRNELSETRFDEFHDPRSKYAAWSSAIELFQEAPALGIGRGAFETSFTRVHPQSGQVIFSHVENEYLQTLLDWGVVGAIAFAIAIGLAGLYVLRRWHRGSLTAAAIGGLTAVGVQSLVDFALELPGLAVPVVIVASTLLYVPVRETTSSFARRCLRGAVIGAAIVIALLAGSARGITVGEDHLALRENATSERAYETFERHPLDYLAAAYISSTSREPHVQIAFVNHALRLHPLHPDLHLVVARWLVATERYPQAAFEYRFALSRGFRLEVLVNEVINRMPASEVAAALPNGQRQWSRIAKALNDRERPDLALAYLETASIEDPRRGREFWKRLFTLANQQKRHVLALKASQQLAMLEPSIQATIRIAESQLNAGDAEGALFTIKPILAQPATTLAHIDAHVLECNTLVSRHEWSAAKQCLTQTLQIPALSVTNRRSVHAQLAKVEAALGNEHAAKLERELSGEKDLDPLKVIESKGPRN